jgi:Ca2+-binding EF-hand superfamily protein
MLAIPTQHLLAQFLVNVAQGEAQIERLRIKLAGLQDFNVHAAFSTLSQGFTEISPNQIMSWCDESGLVLDPADAALVVRQYDADGDGRLEKKEFMSFVLPSTFLSQQGEPKLTTRMSRTVKDTLIELLEKEADLQHDLDLRKKDLTMRTDFAFTAAYKSIDLADHERIDLDQLELFLQKNHFSLSAEHLVGVYRRLDTDGDMQLSYTEFVEALLPYKPIQHRRLMSLPGYAPLKPSRVRSDAVSSPSLSPVKRDSSRLSSPVKDFNPASRFSTPVKKKLSFSEPDLASLADTFKAHIELARELEAMKSDLAVRPDFTAEDLFRMFDLYDRGCIGVREVEDLLDYLGVRFHKDEPTLLVKHYSTHSQAQLYFTEFNDLFMPKDLECARLIKARTPFLALDRRRVFTAETQRRLVEVLASALETERVAETQRQSLTSNSSFSLHEAFLAVDRWQQGYLTLEGFRSALLMHGVAASSKDLEHLMEIYDKDRDGRVSYTEFLSEVCPKSPRKYI